MLAHAGSMVARAVRETRERRAEAHSTSYPARRIGRHSQNSVTVVTDFMVFMHQYRGHSQLITIGVEPICFSLAALFPGPPYRYPGPKQKRIWGSEEKSQFLDSRAATSTRDSGHGHQNRGV